MNRRACGIRGYPQPYANMGGFIVRLICTDYSMYTTYFPNKLVTHPLINALLLICSSMDYPLITDASGYITTTKIEVEYSNIWGTATLKGKLQNCKMSAPSKVLYCRKEEHIFRKSQNCFIIFNGEHIFRIIIMAWVAR